MANKKFDQYIQRDYNVLNGDPDLEPIFTLSDFPTFMGCVSESADNDMLADLTFCISTFTGIIQINPIIPLDIVYQKEHDSGTTGPAWLEHHREFADFIYKQNPHAIFEIGGAHGILNTEYHRNHNFIAWTILESNPTPVVDCSAKFIKGFFDSTTEIDPDVDMIVHSHCLEHFYYPQEFFQNASKVKTGVKMCFSVPNLEAHLKQKFTNVLNFEHTYFCTEALIEDWLQIYNFRLIEKKYYKDDHSIFYAVEKVEHVWPSFYENHYDENLKLLKDWIEYHKNLATEINDRIANTDQSVFLFGGHAFSQFLLAFGVDTTKIKCIIDNNTNKHDKRLYGTTLHVKSPSILKEYERPLVILRSGVFNDEIKKEILLNVNSNTEFME